MVKSSQKGKVEMKDKIKYYIFVENGKLNGCSQIDNSKFSTENFFQIEVSEEIYNLYNNTPEKYIYSEGKIIENTNYESIIKQAELENKKDEIIAKLNDLDLKRIRAVCENEMKDSQKNETWLDYYNSQILKLRQQLEELTI